VSKIKVVHHTKTVGYSGTDRTAQLFCKYLAKSDRYEPFIVYRQPDGNNQRLDVARKWLGDDHVIPYSVSFGKRGRIPPYMPDSDNLHEVLKVIDPQIIHMHRSGYSEWPGFKYLYPQAKWVETNIFGFNDTNPERQFDLNVYISEYIKDVAMRAGNQDGPVLYNPIEQPHLDVTIENIIACKVHLAANHGIPHMVEGKRPVLIGRVGRADNFDPISLLAFAKIEKSNPEAYYFVVNACDQWRSTAERLKIKNIFFLDPIISDEALSRFYMGLDIYAHARSDGECCPCNIQEAMMHGVPVVSHYGSTYNGHPEIIESTGFVVPIADHEAYAEVLGQLVNDQEQRAYYGREGRRRAMRYFDAECVTNHLIKMYDSIL
jgi:glycosyltransferase involved in cell wall biosynthesis